MADATVRVKGLRETQKAFADMDKAVARDLRDELRTLGRGVQQEAAARFASVSPRSAAGFKVRVRRGGVTVEQSLRKTTGLHPEYGGLQMRRALLPALDAKGEEVERGVEHLLDRLARRNGF